MIHPEKPNQTANVQATVEVFSAKWVPTYKVGEVVFEIPASEFWKLIPPAHRVTL